MACGRNRLNGMIQPERAELKSGFAVNGGVIAKGRGKSGFYYQGKQAVIGREAV